MNTVINKINSSNKTIVHLLIALAVMLVFTYLYFVNSAAFNAAAQERMSDKIAEMQSRIGELELSFIEKNDTIDKSLAGDFGLVHIDESSKVFVSRNAGAKLSFNE